MAENQENFNQNTSPKRNINIEGHTNKIEGDIVGGDKIIYAAETDSIKNYLLSITRDEDQLAQRYISLSGMTRKEKSAPTEWPQGLIPTAFKLIDNYLKPGEIDTPVLLNSIEEALSIHKHFVLLGDPGAGKTTTLKKLRLDQAQQALNNKDQKIPILIHLSEWPEDIKDVSNFIVYQQKLQGIPELHFSQMLILFDGLNEMSTLNYSKRVALLNSWLKTNISTSMIISCRSIVYLEREKLSIPTVQVYELDEPRIQHFLHAYLGEQDGSILLNTLRPEDPKKRSKRDLVHLAANPFLLSMISYVYIQRNKKLPSSRGQLFHMFIDVLYAREVEKGTAKGINYEDLVSGLSSIAFSMQSKRTALTMPVSWVKKQIPSALPSTKELLNLANQASLIVLSKDDETLRYSHQLIMEYFAAELFIKKLNNLNKIIQTPVIKNRRRVSGNWDEISYMAIGLTDASDFLSKIAPRDPILAIDCLNHAPLNYSPTQEILEILIENLLRISKLEKDTRQVAIVKLCGLGPQIIPHLSNIFSDKKKADTLTRRSILAVISRLDDPSIRGILEKGLVDTNRWVRRDTTNIIAEKSLFEEMGIVQELNDAENVESAHKNIQSEITQNDDLYFTESETQLNNSLTVNKESISFNSQPNKSAKSKNQEYTGLNYTIQTEITNLGSRTSSIRRKARKDLINFGEITVPYLIKALEHKSANVRRGAVYCLGEIKDSVAIKHIVPLLKDSEHHVRAWAVRALMQFSNYQMNDLLIELTENESPDVLIQAINGLIKLNDQRVNDILIKLTYSSHIDVVVCAINGLGELKNYRNYEHIVKFLNRPEALIVGATIKTLAKLKSGALSELKDIRTFEHIVRFLDHPDILVVIATIKSLGELKDTRSFDLLITYLNHPNLTIVSSAISSLGKLQDIRATKPLIELLTNVEPIIRREAAGALGNISDNQALSPLMLALYDPDRRVKINAIIAIGKIGDRQSLEELEKIKNDADDQVVMAASMAIQRILQF